MKWPKDKGWFLLLLPGGVVIYFLYKWIMNSLSMWPKYKLVFTGKGLSARVAMFAYYQSLHETAGFTSSLFKDLNNVGGYTFKNQPGATKGRRLPEAPTVFYAKYDSVEDSIKEQAAYYARPSTSRVGLTRAQVIDELQTIMEFAQFLKDERYYTDSVTNYANGLSNYAKKYPVS